MYTKPVTLPHYSMKQVVSALFILCILSFGTYHIVSASHEVQAANVRQELSFKSISVTGKDTLWSIAKENYSKEYGSLNDYIKEIKRCNSLTSDRINAGSSIIVPIYVSSEQS